MNPFSRFFKNATEPPKQSPVGRVTVRVVSVPEELEWERFLPVELRFLFAHDPSSKEKVRKLLAAGRSIGVRTVEQTPERVLEAVKHVSFYSQHNCILTWLPELLRDKHLPAFTDEDRARARERGADLDADVRAILDARLTFKKLVLVDGEYAGVGSEEQRLMRELSESLYPLAVDYIVHRIVIDNANERTEIAQNIIKAMLFIGPITHMLEKFMPGVGKVFAATTDDLMAEAAEISALRGSGFSWKELRKRFVILVPIFALATYGAFQVEPLLEHGYVLLAGALFGLSAVALSLTTAIQSIGMYLGSVRALKREGKWHDHGGTKSDLWAAIVQDFTNPARLGLLLGASLAPIMGMLAASLGGFHNGWVLAGVGSTESIVAGLTVIFSSRIAAWRFRRGLERRIAR